MDLSTGVQTVLRPRYGIKHLLTDQLDAGTPAIVLAGSVVIPYIIAYAAHFSGTRVLRLALLPLSWLCAGWVIINASDGMNVPGLTIEDRQMAVIRAVQSSLFMVVLNVTVVMRWAIAPQPPVYQPIPRKPYFHGIRETTAFKALGLLLNKERHIGISPSPPLQLQRRTTFQAISRRFLLMMWSLFLIDLVTYPAYHSAPDTLGSPFFIGGNYYAWRKRNSMDWGIPELAVQLWWTILLAGGVIWGLYFAHDMIALIGVASGLWVDEEYPRIMDKPWLATSLNELWSKRYHQTLFAYMAYPFVPFGRDVHLVASFLASAIFHLIIYSSISTQLAIWPYILFFGGNGLGVVLERIFWHRTGKRVGGIWGLLWMWTWLLLVSGPIVAHEYSYGWAGTLRGALGRNRWLSVLEWMAYGLGYASSPLMS